MKQAVAYLRVSTEGQVERYGFDAQEDAIRGLADELGIEVIRVFREEGISGKVDVEERVAWVTMMDFMNENSIDTLMVYSSDRLSRKSWIQGKILDEFRRQNREIISVSQPNLMSDAAQDVLTTQIMAAIYEYERSLIVSRMKAGRVAKARRGGHAVGRIPLGYASAVIDGHKALIKKDEEVRLVQFVMYLRDKYRLSFNAIAERLDAEGYKPKTWTPEKQTKFYASTVHKIYNNPKYRGLVVLQENGTVLASAENDSLKIVD